MRLVVACLYFLSAFVLRAGEALSANPLPNPGFEDGNSLWAVEGAAQVSAVAAHAGRLGVAECAAAVKAPVAPGP